MRILKSLFVWLVAISAFADPTPKPTARVTLAWDAVADPMVTEVKVYYGFQSRTYENFFVVPANQNTCTINGLETGAEYFFTATAISPFGESPYSNEIEVIFDGKPRTNPPAPLSNFGPTKTENEN